MNGWVIHPAAQGELEKAFEYYLTIDKELALDFNRHYILNRQNICRNPLAYRIRRLTVRRVNLSPRFSEYYIAYMVRDGRIIILAVAHAKRKPFYWDTRIADADKMR